MEGKTNASHAQQEEADTNSGEETIIVCLGLRRKDKKKKISM